MSASPAAGGEEGAHSSCACGCIGAAPARVRVSAHAALSARAWPGGYTCISRGSLSVCLPVCLSVSVCLSVPAGPAPDGATPPCAGRRGGEAAAHPRQRDRHTHRQTHGQQHSTARRPVPSRPVPSRRPRAAPRRRPRLLLPPPPPRPHKRRRGGPGREGQPGRPGRRTMPRRGGLPAPAAARRPPPLLLLRLLLLAAPLQPGRGLNLCTSGSATSCEECLLIHPKCAWCSKEDFSSTKSITSRCDFLQNLLANGCAGAIENPSSSISVVRNVPLSSKGSGQSHLDVTQITPQKVALNLRPGDRTSFRVQVRQVEDYPVDLYYLMDLSLSMNDDLDNIRNLGTKLAEEMRKLTSNFRLGFGSFVDKNISPFSYTAPRYQNNPCTGYKLFPSCVPSFGFRHLLSLTDKVDRFNEEVRKQKVSRNRDAPEGGFDAILQAAVCKEKIGWRKEASHLLVFTTDDVPHIALDGKLGGLVQPHDGQCHLNEANEYSASSQLDYPSLALLGEKLAENNIHLIFAVTRSHYMLYKNFTTLIPGTTVEILHKDSKNIIELIVKAYNSIRSKVELTVWDSPEDIGLTFTATCQDGLSYPGLRKCGDLKIGDTVSFEVAVEARSCPAEDVSHSFTIKPAGFRDTLEVAVSYRCQCGCTGRAAPASAKCSGNGTYACGLCECEPGYLGARCECREGAMGELHHALCREAEGKPLCSGRGECSCNQCQCYESEFGNIYGPFCECDDFSCARYKGVLCSGHGECHCGECKCHAGYIGDNCNCSTETDSCVSSDGQMCSGRGACVCGRCQCTEPGAFGETCEKCPTCPGVCSTKRDCIECKLFNSGRLADNQTCQKHCKDEIITTVDALETDDPNAILCAYPVNNCVMKFTYMELPSGKSNLTVLKEPACSSAPSAVTIVLAVIGSVVLIGIILLALWKLLVTIHDRREFDRFQSERSRARYEMASNPLYRKPISTHNVEFTFNKLNKSYNGTVD